MRLIRTEHRGLLEGGLRALRAGAGGRAVTRDARGPAASGPAGLRVALDALCRTAGRAVRQGARILILSDRQAERARAPLPLLLAAGAVHQHLLHKGLRTRLCLVPEACDASGAHHCAALMRYPSEA